MAKTFEVKVYDQDNNYITTWKDVISDIEFNNEINSAGGQLRLQLARNAGDYGEGTDIDFGYNVKVYCYDIEVPEGQIIFQGYITGYTPIYKDERVEVTVLGYGAELNDYILEAGETAYITQSTNNTTTTFGTTSFFGLTTYNHVIQTFTVAASVPISSVTTKLTIPSSTTLQAYIYKMNGATPDIFTDSQISFGKKTVGPVTSEDVNVVFNEPNTLTTGNTYYFALLTGNGSSAAVANTNPYANGAAYRQALIGTLQQASVAVASSDLYFIINQYTGNTTKTYTSQEPTSILTEIIENYNSRGGSLTVPQPIAESSVNQLAKTNTFPTTGTRTNLYAQIIVPKKDITIQYAQFFGGVVSGNMRFAPGLYKGNPALDSINVTGAAARTITLGAGNSLLADFTNYPSGINTISNTTNDTLTVKLTDPITLQRNQSYYILWGDRQASSLTPTNLVIKSASSTDLINDTQVGQTLILNASANGTYNMTYNSTYPASYIKIFESDPTINDGYTSTETTATYTFRVQTILEAINVIKDLSPVNWYWHVDQGRNEIHFNEKNTEPDHFFSLEKDIIDAKFEKRTEDIINTVYFTGGDLGAGVNFYKKYYNADSIATYGVKSAKYTDGRVTVTATADSIANNILENNSQPELRVTLEILDSNNNQGMGYDIETLEVGDVIAVRNITQQVGLSTWDYARWDEARWDYNIYNLSSLRLQIQKIDYKQDTATIYASTLPLDVTKRIENINKDLEELQTAANPTAPS